MQTPRKMRRTITTPSDIIHFASLDKDFPKCDLGRIRTVELTVFRKCVGEELYETLRNHLVDYSNVEMHVHGTTYEENAVVIYGNDNIIYTANEQTSEPPSNSLHWSKAPRFDKECLERLWCDVLGEYMAYSVLIPNAPLLLSKFKNGTIVRIAGRDIVSGNKQDLDIVIRALRNFRDMAWDNLVHYVLKNNEDGCYDGFRECKPCSVKKKRQNGWRVG